MSLQNSPSVTILGKKIHFGREILRIQAILRAVRPLSLWSCSGVGPLCVAVRTRVLCEAGV